MKKLLGNKIARLIGLAAVLGIVFVLVIQPMLLGGGGGADGEGAVADESHEAQPASPGPTYRLGNRVMNLKGLPQHYLKLGLALEFRPEKPAFYKLTGEARKAAEDEFALELGPMVPLIEDTITTVVATKSLEQISTPAGQIELKRQLLESIGEIVRELELVRVYFTEFVTQ